MNDSVEIFPWNKNFETGISELDHQHFTLVQLLNKLTSHLVNFSEQVIIDEVFSELTDYAIFHFTSEEAIWNQFLIDEEARDEHIKIHNSFLATVLKLKENKNRPQDKVVEDIIKFLTHWLVKHILESDTKHSKIVLALQSGSSLVDAKMQVEKEMNSSISVLLESILNMYDKLSSHTIQLMREVSLRKKLEKEKEELQALALKNSRLQAVTILAAGVAHEINNPLALILGSYKSLKRKCFEENVSDEVLKIINKQEDAAKRAASIIRNLKEITEPTSNVHEPLNLSDVVLSIIESHRQDKEFENIKLETVLLSKKPFFVGNLLSFKKVIYNLLSNASDACAGQVNKRICITTFDQNEHVMLSIYDNGQGIKEEDLNKILTPFFTTKPPGQGTGLGLCIAESLIKTMCGNLNITSESGNGTTVTIFFPAIAE